MKRILNVLLFYGGVPFLASIPFLFICMAASCVWFGYIGVPAAVIWLYIVFETKLDLKMGGRINGSALLVLVIAFTLMMVATKGSVEGEMMLRLYWLFFPFAPVMVVSMLTGSTVSVFIIAFLTYFCGWLYCTLKIAHNEGVKFNVKKIVVLVCCLLLCTGISTYLYINRPSVKYSGHGFQYMHGYSSTDFTDYTVYAEHSKLVMLDKKPSFTIENESDMPILDGAEACYPLYASFAKNVYKDIDKIEKNALKEEDSYCNGKIVSFTNTVVGFERLISDDEDHVDMFFGARPSSEQMELAKEQGVELEITPIGREAFVFFAEKDNPISGLSSGDIKKIYHGDIVNWAELGGKDEKIKAFQRPENSGSQTMMKYFMGDMPLKDADTYEVVDAMDGVIREVAQYANESGAMGYTFRYFLEELNQESGVKMLKVDGVYPTVETIEDGSYPLTVDLCLITRKNDPNPNVQKMKEFIISEDGQTIIRQIGYGGLKK